MDGSCESGELAAVRARVRDVATEPDNNPVLEVTEMDEKGAFDAEGKGKGSDLVGAEC